ncbi:MAG TPA: hypothetical protein VF808_14515 [Ktedonobacterales bacterium]
MVVRAEFGGIGKLWGAVERRIGDAYCARAASTRGRSLVSDTIVLHPAFMLQLAELIQRMGEVEPFYQMSPGQLTPTAARLRLTASAREKRGALTQSVERAGPDKSPLARRGHFRRPTLGAGLASPALP